MSSYQIWPCQVTQAENLSFPYLKSYCPLHFRRSHQILWFCCIPNGSYKEDNLREGRICPHVHAWNSSLGFLPERFSKSIENNNHSRIIYLNDNIARLGKGYFSLNDFYAWAACKGQNQRYNYRYGSCGLL